MEVALFVAALALAGGLVGAGILGAPGGGSWKAWLRKHLFMVDREAPETDFDYGKEDPRR